MTKPRRDELREAARRMNDAISVVWDLDGYHVHLKRAELAALLDSDERLEAVREGLDKLLTQRADEIERWKLMDVFGLAAKEEA